MTILCSKLKEKIELFLKEEKNIKYLKRMKEDLVKDLEAQMKKVQKQKSFQEIMIVAIGSNLGEVNFDTFGPRIGSILEKMSLPNYVKIYGNMNFPIHGKNIQHFMEQHKIEMQNSMVIAIDAAASEKEKKGTIRILDQEIYPGTSLGKDLGKIGDVSIMGRTAQRHADLDTLINSSVSERTLTKMSEITAEVIYEGIQLVLKR